MTATVVVAGGGPVGLMLAAELRLADVPVLVVEPKARIEEHSAGMAVHGRTLQLLERRGLADELRAQGMFAWPRTPFGLLWLDISDAGPEELTYGIPQWRTETVLERRAVELGAEVRRGHRVVAFRQDADGVTVTVRATDGAEQEVRASYLVGCDGADSEVRALAGIGQADHPTSAYRGVFGDVELVEGEQFDAGLHDDGVFGAIPVAPGVLRFMTIEWGSRPEPADGSVTEDDLVAAVERVTGTAPKLRGTGFVARFGRQSTVADRFRDGRVFLAGDAAHVSFVSGTQGLNAGLQDAANLGWKLAAAVTDRAPEGLLDTYEAERRPVALRACDHARAQMALMHPLSKVGPLRDLLDRMLRIGEAGRLLLRMPTLARYPEPGPGDHPLIGEPVPNYPLLTEQGETTVARAMASGRALLVSSADRSPAAELPDGVGAVRAKPLQEVDADFLLVRPDGHVAYAGNDSDALATALRTWFGAA
ncbi:FAD-dependent monooxygenase [Actinosynnema sp. CS-041913]|uniref:FAD-dependent monooxygenase n=1 Tax=Actinosynnema sp. CS-041913 TaxID=3239917 RepID=UPI003D8A120A